MPILFKSITSDKFMSNGSRCLKRIPLTKQEIEEVLLNARKIQMDVNILIFNDQSHIQQCNTCYNFENDVIFIAQNVFPDYKYGSIHPRDLMSVAAVLAHEYYGHRQYRDEYLADWKKGANYYTTPVWKDECRASITAAKIAPGLSNKDRTYLIMDAIKRAEEYGHYIEMDDFMKGVLYGDYREPEKSITPIRIKYVSIESNARRSKIRKGNNGLSSLSPKGRGNSR